jgi:hypothetical protein
MPYTIADVARGLGHVRNSLRDIVSPFLDRTKSRTESGFLVIPREVFTCVDFLGALYGGYGGEMRGRRREIATTDKAVRFLEEMFGKLDAVYTRHGRLAYEMFRHGTVHLQRPNRLRRADGATIEWVLYEGERRGAPILYPRQPARVNHLEPFLIDETANTHALPVSINILFEDVLGAIDLYENELKTAAAKGDVALLTNYGNTMDALMQPEDTTLSW